MKPLKTFEKWLYPSMAAWVVAALWLFAVVVPQHPFVPVFDAVVGCILTGVAAVTAVVALALSWVEKS